VHVRVSKILLVACVAVFASLVAFNNLTDYYSNFEYVRHVLSMDTTFADNRGMWRRIESAPLHHAAYALIILIEIVIAVLAWIGTVDLWKGRHDAAAFERAKPYAVWGLTMAVVLWFGGFIAIGGEWFLMWQSETWNGQPESAMFSTIIGLILIYLVQPDGDRDGLH
jgi:predicted small integral membrane protein